MSFLLPVSAPVRPPSMEGRAVEWKGVQGVAWAQRNPHTVPELDKNYMERFEVTRTAVNLKLLARVPRTASVLEVGCSAGCQLNALAAVGFTNLEGVDLSAEAIAFCDWPAQVADGCRLPYPVGAFDMVMISGTLMHVPPHEKLLFMAELKRVARRWIYGVEMWSRGFLVWDFADLIPPAWTCDWYTILNDPAWPIVERRHLIDINDRSPLAAFLMERV